jgi:hypothetical protein
MKCHICGKEMRVVKSVLIDESDFHQNTEETWRCDDCDKLSARIKRFVLSGRIILPLLIIVSVVMCLFLLYVMIKLPPLS